MNSSDDMTSEDWKTVKQIIIYSLITITVFTVALMAGCPQYNVYEQRLEGEAILAKAHGARQALVAQAEAEKDAARLRAEAIAIVGQAAKDFPEYRQQEFIGAFAEAMHHGRINQIFYVPTEANIPILPGQLHHRGGNAQ